MNIKNDKSISWIPRNLIENDYIDMGFGIKMGLHNLPLTSIGAILAYVFSKDTPSIIIKGITFSILIVGFYLISNIKIEDQNCNELCQNWIIYKQKKSYYKRRRS